MAKTLATRLVEMMPPWLQRTTGARVLGGIGDVLDARASALSEAVRLRFPRAAHEDALAYIGRERRIRRGPNEAAGPYASRMLRWWDAHRARGSAYEMLRQLRDYFAATPEVERIDIVAASGRRHWVDVADPDVFTRDSVTWDPAPEGEWAHVWVFLFTDGPPSYSTLLVTHAGEVLVTHLGDDLVAITDLSGGGTLAEEEAEVYRAIPREWSAAHIPYVTVVLLWGDGLLYGYPTPVATYGDGHVYGEDTPVVLIAE